MRNKLRQLIHRYMMATSQEYRSRYYRSLRRANHNMMVNSIRESVGK